MYAMSKLNNFNILERKAKILFLLAVMDFLVWML